MKNIKKLLGGLLAFAIACSSVVITEIPAYAAEDDEEFAYDDNLGDEEIEELKLSLDCYGPSEQLADEYLSSDFAKKGKTIKDFYSVSVYDQDYEYVDAAVSYKVVKEDKYLAFKNNTLTIKKGITVGTHKIKVKITATKKGYESSSETKIITVKIKKPRTSGTISGKADTDLGNVWDLPVDVAGTYQVTISGPGAKKFNVYRASAYNYQEKQIKSGAKIKFNPNKNALYLIAKNYNPDVWESYQITIKLKKVSN